MKLMRFRNLQIKNFQEMKIKFRQNLISVYNLLNLPILKIISKEIYIRLKVVLILSDIDSNNKILMIF